MRLLLLALVVGVSGCGSLVPYSLAPGWLAPDVVPDETASGIVVTDTTPGAAALVGRVIDGRTGNPLSGAAVLLAGGAETVTGDDGRFVLAPSEDLVRLRVVAPGYVPAEGEVPTAGRTTVLVLLDRVAVSEGA